MYVDYDLARLHPIERLYEMHNGICWLCHEHVELTDATRDHVIPRSLGGAFNWDNLALAHADCNHQRDDRFPAQRTFRGVITTRRQQRAWSASKGRCRTCGAGHDLFFQYIRGLGGDYVEVSCCYCAGQPEVMIRDANEALRTAQANTPRLPLRIETSPNAVRPTVTPADIVRQLGIPTQPSQAAHSSVVASRPYWRRALDRLLHVLRRRGED